MNVFIVLVTLLSITTIGYLVMQLFHFLSKKDALLKISCSYGLGIGLIILQLFIYSELHIPWSRELLILPWIIFVGGMLIKLRKNFHVDLPKIPQFTKIQILLMFGIALSCGYVFFEALLRPPTAMDTWGFWLFQSKAFFHYGSIDPTVFKITNIDYPPVMYLFGTFIYIILGEVDDTAVLLTSFWFYVSLAVLFFAVLKRRYGVIYALLFTFLLVTTQTFVRQGGRLEAGLADLPIGYYSLISLTLLLEYIKTNNKKLFLLLNIVLAIMALVKFDGIPITIVIGVFALYHIYRKKLYNHLSLVLFWIVPIISWQLFKELHQISPTYFSAHRWEISFDKTLNAISGTLLALINIKSWNMLWILYFFSFIISGVKRNNELIIINSIIISQLCIYLFLYIFTAGNAPNSSIERLLVHIAPLALLYLAFFIRLVDKSFLKKL